LNLIQWYEGYCRLTYPTDIEDKLAFENRISNIVNQIEAETDKKLIEDITKFSYETPLRPQLKKLLAQFALNVESKYFALFKTSKPLI